MGSEMCIRDRGRVERHRREGVGRQAHGGALLIHGGHDGDARAEAAEGVTQGPDVRSRVISLRVPGRFRLEEFQEMRLELLGLIRSDIVRGPFDLDMPGVGRPTRHRVAGVAADEGIVGAVQDQDRQPDLSKNRIQRAFQVRDVQSGCLLYTSPSPRDS